MSIMPQQRTPRRQPCRSRPPKPAPAPALAHLLGVGRALHRRLGLGGARLGRRLRLHLLEPRARRCTHSTVDWVAGVRRQSETGAEHAVQVAGRWPTAASRRPPPAQRRSHGPAPPSAPRSFCRSSPGVLSRKEACSMAVVSASTSLAASSPATAAPASMVMDRADYKRGRASGKREPSGRVRKRASRSTSSPPARLMQGRAGPAAPQARSFGGKQRHQ